MDLTTNQKRQIAALSDHPGWRLVIDQVVRSKRDQALDRLKLAKTGEAILSASCKFVAWDEVLVELSNAPQEIAKILKEEKDTVYG